MAITDDRIDAYIAKSADFAKPILLHIRKLVHKSCPEVQETIKWGMPFFEYAGSLLCNMAAFKQHCALGFWNASLLKDPEGILQTTDKNAMGHLDRITAMKDLPSDKILLSYLREAASLNEAGIKKPAPKKTPKKELPIPEALLTVLKKNKKAQTAFEALPPSHRREYIEWIMEAKTETTREKRIAMTVEWILEGKSRNWKYEKK